MTAPTTTETRSEKFPERMNVIIEGESFEEVQGEVFNIMDREGHATFDIPKRAAGGRYFCYGHFPYRASA